MHWRGAAAVLLSTLAFAALATEAIESYQGTDDYVILELRDHQESARQILGGCFRITSMEGLAPRWIVCDNITANQVKHQGVGDLTNTQPLNDSNAVAGTIWAHLGEYSIDETAVQIVELTPPQGSEGYINCSTESGECRADGVFTMVGSTTYLEYPTTPDLITQPAGSDPISIADTEISALNQRILELEARIEALEQRQVPADLPPLPPTQSSQLPDPLIPGTEITIQSFPYGMYVPPNSNIEAKLFTLACSIQLPNVDDQLQVLMYGYGQPVAWLTCGWLPGAYR